MSVQVRFLHPVAGAVFVELEPGDRGLSIGRSSACTYTFDPPNLSRIALVIESADDGRARVVGGQSIGFVRATRVGDGVAVATLSSGADQTLGAGTYQLSLKVEGQTFLTLELDVPESWRPAQPGSITQGFWTRNLIMNPTPEDEWRWLAALVTIAWRTGATRKSAYPNLKLLGVAWHGGTWRTKNVSDRLSDVLVKLGYTGTYPDKIAVIADDVLHSNVIARADYLDFEAEVKRRAVIHLNRADLGKLGWGRLAGGP